MSDTTVAVREEKGARVPSPAQVSVIEGHSVTFQAADAPSTLYFSPDLTEILTPKPATSVSLTPGKNLTYTFASADPGAYEILFQTPEMDAPQHFDPAAADHTSFLLLLKTGTGAGYGVTSNPLQTIHASAAPQAIASPQPHGIMSELEATPRGITSNPLQT